MEAVLYKKLKTYGLVDTIICPSAFLKEKLDQYDILKDKTIVMHNFVDRKEWTEEKKEDYVLYFGRFSEEKGVRTLIQACRELPDIPFVFAGGGTLEQEIASVGNKEPGIFAWRGSGKGNPESQIFRFYFGVV